MNALRAAVACSVVLLGCGDGGPGAPGSFTPPTRGGGGTVFAGSGTDRSGGGDRGGGGTTALGGASGAGNPSSLSSSPSTCVSNEDCIGGRCARASSVAVGYCIQACGDVACTSGYECVAGDTGRLCLAPCTTSAECPSLGGFSAACVTVTELGRFCIWTASQQS